MNRSQRTSADPSPSSSSGPAPPGVTAATLLGQYGVECLVLDRWDGVYPQPRAVHLDDEIYRILARLGIAEQFAAVSRPTRGLQLVDRNHRVFAVFDRARRPRPARAPPGQHVRPARARAPAAHQPQGPAHGHACAGTSRSPTSPRTARAGSGWTSPTGSPASTSPCWPPTCWAATEPTASCARRSAPRWRTSSSSSAGW